MLLHNKAMKKTSNPHEKIGYLIKPYPGQWVTLSSDKTEVLGHSRQMESALNQAYKNGESQPYLIKSPDGSTAAYIY